MSCAGEVCRFIEILKGKEMKQKLLAAAETNVADFQKLAPGFIMFSFIGKS